MTRQRSDKPSVRRQEPSGRPEPLGRVPASAERLTAAVERSLMRYGQPDPGYWPPLTDTADARAIRRAERWRDRELADGPLGVDFADEQVANDYWDWLLGA